VLSSIVSNSQRPDLNFKPNGSPLNQGHASGYYISPKSSLHQYESLFDQ
jgi:hypothetical protein